MSFALAYWSACANQCPPTLGITPCSPSIKTRTRGTRQSAMVSSQAFAKNLWKHQFFFVWKQKRRSLIGLFLSLSTSSKNRLIMSHSACLYDNGVPDDTVLCEHSTTILGIRHKIAASTMTVRGADHATLHQFQPHIHQQLWHCVILSAVRSRVSDLEAGFRLSEVSPCSDTKSTVPRIPSLPQSSFMLCFLSMGPRTYILVMDRSVAQLLWQVLVFCAFRRMDQ